MKKPPPLEKPVNASSSSGNEDGLSVSEDNIAVESGPLASANLVLADFDVIDRMDIKLYVLKPDSMEALETIFIKKKNVFQTFPKEWGF